jgi:hypothetical protein
MIRLKEKDRHDPPDPQLVTAAGADREKATLARGAKAPDSQR